MPQFRTALLAICLALALPGAAGAAVTYQFSGTFAYQGNPFTASFTVERPTPITTDGLVMPDSCTVSPSGACGSLGQFFGPSSQAGFDLIALNITFGGGAVALQTLYRFADGAFLANGTYTTGGATPGGDGFGTLTVRGIPDQTPVPAPMSLAVLGAGLLGLAALRRRG